MYWQSIHAEGLSLDLILNPGDVNGCIPSICHLGITDWQVLDRKRTGGESGIRIRLKTANKVLNRARLAIVLLVSVCKNGKPISETSF